ncbi:MAG: hypothetical protein GX557_10780, partial [Chloroflexi bacterium]|nr:hypothetical protein [Chloroflexota bacterium]
MASGPLCLSQSPGADRAPQLALGADGRVLVAWKHTSPENDSAALRLADGPSWQPTSLVNLPVELVDAIALQLPRDADQQRLLWSSPIGVRDFPSGTRVLAWESLAPAGDTGLPVVTTSLSALDAPTEAVSQLDAQGRLHSAWLQDNAIRYRAETPISLTLPITLPLTEADLAFGLDDAGNAHFAVLVRSETGAEALLYLPANGAPASVTEATDLGDMRLFVGAGGAVHLVWRADGGLYHADSRDWSAARAMVATAPRLDQWAAAAGPDETLHIAWLADETLHYAVDAAGVGVYTRRLAAVPMGADICLGIDSWNRRHIAWSAQNPEGDWEVYYLAPEPRPLQLAVSAPAAGDTLLGDTQVQVVTNGPAAALQRVECYLQEAEDPTEADPTLADLRYLGPATADTEGWSAPLALDGLRAGRSYRVVAYALGSREDSLRALGGWFTAQPAGSLWAAPDGLYRGRATLRIAGDGAYTAMLPVVVALQPVSDGLPQCAREDSPPSLLIAPAPPAATTITAVDVDTRALADGAYAVTVGPDSPAQPAPNGVLRVSNALAPEVRITAPHTQIATSDRVFAAANASDPDGVVRRVDFFLERTLPLAQEQPSGEVLLSMPERVWLGSDSDGSNGWSVRVPVMPEFDGDGWAVRAIAYDDDDLSSSVLSQGTFAVHVQPRTDLRFLSPQANAVVSGTHTVAALATREPLDQAALYLEDAGGRTIPLGLMTFARSQWSLEWDTTALADGAYVLTMVGWRAGALVSRIECAGLQVSNGVRGWSFDPALAGQTISGYARVRVQAASDAAPARAMRLYCRDGDGSMAHVGDGLSTDQGWEVLWDTAGVLDGTYDLVAQLELGAPGGAAAVGSAVLSTRVQVRNNALGVTLSRFTSVRPLQGEQTLEWTVRGAQAEPLLDLAYSPDNGLHWLAVAEGLPSKPPYVWDTRAYPDSTHGLLRVTVRAGAQRSSTLSVPFGVNNTNSAPTVALLHPSEGSTQSGRARVVWHATDPDGDALVVRLDYRRGDGAWLALDAGLPNTGAYEWALDDLTPAADYQLRITVRDAGGAIATDLVRFACERGNTPPAVELLWPNGAVTLSEETVILWNAEDAEDDPVAVDLFYSDNAGQTWIPLAEGLGDTGYYQWQVSSLPPGDTYRLRVVARDPHGSARGESNELFRIGDPAWLDAALLSPAPDAVVSGIAVVRWTSGSAASSRRWVSLQFRRVGAAAWQTVALDLFGAGVHLWNTRALPDGDYELRLGVSADGTQLAARYTQPRPVTVRNTANHPPEVEFLAPLGGERWAGVHEIAWRAQDRDGDLLSAVLWYSRDGGQQWSQIARVDAALGRYLWDTRTLVVGGEYTLRITVTDGRAVARAVTPSPLRVNDRTVPPTASLSSPGPDGALTNGAVIWSAADADGDDLRVGLDISLDGGASWETLSDDLPLEGRYVLAGAVSSYAPATLDGRSRVRLTLWDGRYRVQIPSAPLIPQQIGAVLPELVVESPEPGATLSGVEQITWRLASPYESRDTLYDIEYSRDNGATWLTQVRGLLSQSAYRWDTRDLLNGVYLLRLTAVPSDRGGLAVAGWQAVSGPFVIDNAGANAPVVSVLRPTGGEIVSGTREVRWLATDADGDALRIALAYSLDRGATWRPIASDLANTGGYVWDTTLSPNCGAVWLRVTASDGSTASHDCTDAALAVQNPYAPVVTLRAPAPGEPLAALQRIAWVSANEPTQWVRA